MSMMSEFKDFAMRGNVIDMAVGIVIGTQKAATSLSQRTIYPIYTKSTVAEC